MNGKTLLFGLLCLLAAPTGAAQDPETRLLHALSALQTQGVDAATDEMQALLGDYPHFRLAHLVYGDLLLARAGQARALGDPGLPGAADREPILRGLQEEARQRLRAQRDTAHKADIPLELLQLGTKTQRAVLVEKARNRLYLFSRNEQGQPPRLLADYYISYGRSRGDKRAEGDLRTPEGVYFVNDHIPDAELVEKYGRGAYPIDYPNPLDRKLGKTGYGIWLHGVERDIYSRPPLASEGCVVLANSDLLALGTLLQPGRTPVVIAERLHWADADTWRRERDAALAAVRAWETDWESLDPGRYLSHYAKRFWAKGHDLRSWSTRKKRVFSRKTFQQVEIEDLNLLRYPGNAGDGRDVMVASFDQRFRSNNYNSDDRKRIFWVREQGDWRVLYEGEG